MLITERSTASVMRFLQSSAIQMYRGQHIVFDESFVKYRCNSTVIQMKVLLVFYYLARLAFSVT